VAHTPSGTFRVYKKINGWRRSALGLLYYPSYIVKGYAIHGSRSAPAFPASHGCIRIPMFAAAEFSKLATMEMVVVVYDKTQVGMKEEE
jgi:lipoprotein-anchoring transpeptidase ErfK/SrfK